MNSLYQKINEYLEKKEQIWIITITANTGSIPGKTGMKMLISQKGEIEGTIGGGILEHWVIKRVLDEKPSQSCVWTYELNEDFEAKVGMICGGSLSFLIEPLIEGDYLYIYGAGHCAIALSELAVKCGFIVIVIDDRNEWSNPNKHPFAFKTLVCDYSMIFDHINLNDKAYHIIMTHGHCNDEKLLKLLIDKNLFYLGMLGSEQKVNICFNNLLKQGIDQTLLNKVHAPIGVKIGSHDPMEIAVSIMAELIKIRNSSKDS